MFFRFFFLCFFLLSFCYTKSADLENINTAISSIANLVEFNKYDLVEKKADSLYELIKNSNYTEQILKLKLYKAIVIDRNGDLSKALALYLDILSKAEKNNFNAIICETNIYISLIHEKNSAFDLAYSYINKAKNISKQFGIEHLYCKILVRLSSIHRMVFISKIKQSEIQKLNVLGFEANLDTALSLAKQAIPIAEKHNKRADLKGAYFLVGAILRNLNRQSEGFSYTLKSLELDKLTNDTEAILFYYVNVARLYVSSKDFKNALKYNDTSLNYVSNENILANDVPFKQRAEIYNAMGNKDSAYYYLNLYIDFLQKKRAKQNEIDTKKLEQEYQNLNKEQTIKEKNNQLTLLLTLFSLILVFAIILFFKNKQIKTQNNIINSQIVEMEKTIEQKQILLSELQHRVKNNLQYVISILEIQKESVSYNNIDELIRSNQNRIHSLALLHKKLSVNENVNEVDLKKYVTNLSELVKDSYKSEKNDVSLFINCSIDILSLTKALPIGLIIVELISNSMKHAFKKKSNGIISIEIFKDESLQKNCLHYIDNGVGFEFDKTQPKGIGIEIMKGLIDQLNGTIKTLNNEGFQLKIYF